MQRQEKGDRQFGCGQEPIRTRQNPRHKRETVLTRAIFAAKKKKKEKRKEKKNPLNEPIPSAPFSSLLLNPLSTKSSGDGEAALRGRRDSISDLATIRESCSSQLERMLLFWLAGLHCARWHGRTALLRLSKAATARRDLAVSRARSCLIPLSSTEKRFSSAPREAMISPACKTMWDSPTNQNKSMDKEIAGAAATVARQSGGQV